MDILNPKKSLGQHFLIDLSVAQKTVETIKGFSKIPILEIGPGIGTLTKLLLQKNNNIVVVEIDKRFVNFLQKKYPKLSGHITELDFLQLNLNDVFPQNFGIIGNYPYHLSSQILFKILDYKNKIIFCSGILQKEFVQRLVSPPGNKVYGIITIFIQAWYNVEYLFTVSPSCFSPPPKVQSAIFRMVRNKRTKLGCDEYLFKAIVKKSFNQRRKILRNSLSKLFKKTNSIFYASIFDKRPEQLSIEEFIWLTNLLSEQEVSKFN